MPVYLTLKHLFEFCALRLANIYYRAGVPACTGVVVHVRHLMTAPCPRCHSSLCVTLPALITTQTEDNKNTTLRMDNTLA